ncbi:MAG: tRNA (guanosine(46)-N7)-methyltransferase TrmB [Oscillospiraceae bacterium]|nr:tRNA (guanosine(46)-N7)-methyltransferase TrmB [Oscillospiraceae bacterium]
MRIRHKPWAQPELDASSIYIRNPHDCYGRWKDAFENPDQEMHLELGCGRGTFIAKKAVKNPDINYLAIDIKSDMLGYANRNVQHEYMMANRTTNNILMCTFDIERIALIISEEDTFSRIYINFCNPWPKDRHKKRRLTHTKQLTNYKKFLKKGGQIFFKTDDDELFTESLDYFKECGFRLDFITYDMTENSLPDNIITEHEKMFMDEGIKIKGLIATYTED